jgi:hypothetical protein
MPTIKPAQRPEAPQPELPVSACRSCGKPIVWALTVTGGRMPVDRDPCAEGTIELAYRRGVWAATVLDRAARRLLAGHELVLRQSHFASCPDAAAWRSRQRAAPER